MNISPTMMIIEVFGSLKRWIGWYTPNEKTAYLNMDRILIHAKKTNSSEIDWYFMTLFHEEAHHLQYINGGLTYTHSRARKERKKADMMEEMANEFAYRKFIRVFKRKPDTPNWFQTSRRKKV